MEFVTELDKVDKAIKLGLEGFKLFILDKLKTNKNYLEQFFWAQDGLQMTVLNYLIQQHQEIKDDSAVNKSSADLTEFIDFVLGNAADKNVGQPLHQAIASGKIQLALHLLDGNVFDVDRYDEKGRTLLSLTLATKNPILLKKILVNKPNVNAITLVSESRVAFQPLHEAVVLNFAAGVRYLGRAGAQLANPTGLMRDTPVLLAARMGKIRALEALLEFNAKELDLNAENNTLSPEKKRGDNAMESLCKLLADDDNNKELLRGVAMLLCRGAEPPRSEVLCQLLAEKRSELLKEIDQYLDKRPDLVDSFVNRCHMTDSALHKIVYVDHSWGNALRQLFGRPSEAAFIIEKLVTRKYSRRDEEHPESSVLPTVAAVPLKRDEPAIKLYAEFVRRYTEAYEGQRITNPWSSMRWMIAEGKCNWKTVQEYARNHPGSRTQIIVDEMFKKLPPVQMHEHIASTSGTLDPHKMQQI